MPAVALSPSATPELVLLLLFVFIVGRRTYAMLQGTRFSLGRVFAFAALYVLLFAALAFATLYSAVGTWGASAYSLLAPYVALPVVSALLIAPYVQRTVQFERRDDGQWYYRLTWQIPVAYLSLFVTRFIAEIVVYGPSSAFALPPPAPPSTTALWILIGVDLLFGISLGLLVGRGWGVYRAYRELPPSPGPPPPLTDTPLPSR